MIKKLVGLFPIKRCKVFKNRCSHSSEILKFKYKITIKNLKFVGFRQFFRYIKNYDKKNIDIR